jgi:argininosuccinate lyase
MPQKKNPDFAELIRGRTGKVYGDMIALFTMMKGLPLSYNRDLQEDKSSFFDAYDTVYSCLGIFTQMIATAKWNKDRMEKSCIGGYANATDVADYLVKKGMPFRTAHGVAAKAVRIAIEKNCNLEDLDLKTFQNCSSLIQEDIYSCIRPRQCMEQRKTTGGPAPEKVKEQIIQLENYCVKNNL